MRTAWWFIITLILAACSSQALGPKTRIEFRPATFTAQAGWSEMTVKETQQKIYLSETTIITSQDIASAEATFTEQGMPIVGITLTATGKQKLALATEQYLNQPIGIVVNGELLSAPVIREKITGGFAMISGIATAQEAKAIADGLNQ
jgi:preprotein translocase subunit SecD